MVSSDELAVAFEGALVPEVRDRFTDRAALQLQLAAGLAAAQTEWPGLAIAPARFSSELARRLAATATPELLGQLRYADVYLAIGCAAGDERAIKACEDAVLSQVNIAGKHVRATADQIAEVRARVQRILFVDEPTRPAATSEFAGRGDIRGYVRVIATRELIRLVNRERREVHVDDETMFDALVPAGDPALSMMRERYRGDVDQAMRTALASLDDRSRALLRYSLIDGWSIDRIGKLYGVHRATAARWIAETRELLGERIRETLAARLAMATADVDSIVRLVQSRVDMSLERLLED
jgi:RNA polymerase sigma-70 factor, ECF subfamily